MIAMHKETTVNETRNTDHKDMQIDRHTYIFEERENMKNNLNVMYGNVYSANALLVTTKGDFKKK